MIVSSPTAWRSAASAGRMKLDPTWHWRAQYSLGRKDRPSTTGCPHSYSWEPTALPIRSQKKSRVPRVSGSQAVPCSVKTNCRSGWRSITPLKMRCHRARWAHQVTSSMNTTCSIGSSPMAGTALPLWWLIGSPAASQADQIGS